MNVVWERMGPGGLRGLQILRLGVKSVRGGFDSHAFPPLLLALAWLPLLGVPAAAAAGLDPAPAPWTEPAAGGRSSASWFGASALAALSDSGSPSRATADRTRPPEPSDSAAVVDIGHQKRVAPPPLSGFDKPRWVMLRSLLVPGWGQLHNRAYFKAVFVAGEEVYLVARLAEDSRELNRLRAEAEAAAQANQGLLNEQLVEAHNRLLDRYVARQWFLAALMAFSLADAYVDAHFKYFKLEFQNDPSLPGTVESEARLFLRWSF